ncbi:hypothetical protein C6986_02215 [Escherichia coli]|nr:hypothetical protein C6986_02215 [Escherichia coli]
MTSLKTSIKTITYLSDTGCLEIQGASLVMLFSQVLSTQTSILKVMTVMPMAYWTPMVAGLMTHLMLMN